MSATSPDRGRREEVKEVRTVMVKARKAAGYTQQSISDELHISRSHYSQIESGEKNPSLALSMRIKKVLGYPYDDLFFNPKRPVSGPKREKQTQ